MSDLERLMKLVSENNGHITTKQVVENNINKMALKRLCDDKKLERVSTGYYCLPGTFIDEYYKVLSKCKSAVFSFTTALYLHDLTDRTPIYFDITVQRGYGGNLQNIDNIYLHYVDKEILNLGMIEIKSPFGMNIKCYDVERTICDLIKDKNNMDKEIYSKALKEYAKRKDKDLLKLAKYAKKLNIEKDLVDVMEVLL